MDNRTLIIGLTFVVYLLVLLAIGFVAWRRTRDLARWRSCLITGLI